MSTIPTSYRQLRARGLPSTPFDAWVSTELLDPKWDDYLRSIPTGQFQQSALWAAYKASDGWKHYRVVLTHEGEIDGGFQILWKKKGPVRVGYINKGPVCRSGKTETAALLKTLLAQSAQTLRLTLLIAQEPDETPIDANSPRGTGFIEANPAHLIEATWLVDVSDGAEAVRARMSQRLKKHMQMASKAGVSIREGTVADLDRFFALMKATCDRLGTTPNPPTPQALRRLWDLLTPTHTIRLTLAELNGTAIGGLLCIPWGNRYSLWKKGRDSNNPNTDGDKLLTAEALERAGASGYELADYCSFSKSSALKLRSDPNADFHSFSGNDQFKIRFGGYPKILPSAQLYFPNPLLRALHRFFPEGCNKILSKLGKSAQ